MWLIVSLFAARGAVSSSSSKTSTWRRFTWRPEIFNRGRWRIGGDGERATSGIVEVDTSSASRARKCSLAGDVTSCERYVVQYSRRKLEVFWFLGGYVTCQSIISGPRNRNGIHFDHSSTCFLCCPFPTSLSSPPPLFQRWLRRRRTSRNLRSVQRKLSRLGEGSSEIPFCSAPVPPLARLLSLLFWNLLATFKCVSQRAPSCYFPGSFRCSK